ncbi:TPA: V-type ATPase subunit [Candidatus Woesearchaeota archaeon]|nr:V-type ATPase subunit [Candidatus Woesearchaeota archaeon]
MNESYAAARIHAMLSRNMTDAQYNALANMSIPEIFSMLQSGDYREDINALSLRDLDDPEVVDRMLVHNSRRLIGKIRHIAGGEFTEALERYAKNNDEWNLRVVLEAIASGNDPHAAITQYGKQGTLDTAGYERARTVAEFARMITERLHVTGDLSTTHGIAIALRGLHAAPESRARKDRVMDRTYDLLIDCDNIITIILLKRDGVHGARALERLHRGGTIRQSTLRDACEPKSVIDTLRALERTPFRAAVTTALRRGDDDRFVMLEYDIRMITLRMIKRMAGIAPLHAAVLMHYLVDKEREHHNLRLIIKAKHLGLDATFIQSHMMLSATPIEKSDATKNSTGSGAIVASIGGAA